MRTFTLGSGTDRKVVTVEVRGTSLAITQTKAEGVGKRTRRNSPARPRRARRPSGRSAS